MARRIGFLGPVGTYTEEAALQYDPEAELQPFPTISAVGLAVSSEIGRSEMAIEKDPPIDYPNFTKDSCFNI